MRNEIIPLGRGYSEDFEAYSGEILAPEGKTLVSPWGAERLPLGGVIAEQVRSAIEKVKK